MGLHSEAWPRRGGADEDAGLSLMAELVAKALNGP
jgi:hypothetical protein